MITREKVRTVDFEKVKNCDCRQDTAKQAHSDAVLAALVGFYEQKRTNSGQIKRQKCLFGHRNKENDPKAAIL